jgi:membrane associated rhomboid family serine protease
LILANVAVFLLQVFVTREVRLSPLEMLRKQDPELDRLLTERAEDPEALEELKKEYPEYKEALEDKKSPRWRHLTLRVSIVQEWCELDAKKVVYQGQVWRLLTHAFCHDRYGLFHILFNMLFLYWFGSTLESMYGSREFLLFYLTAAVLAGLAFVGLELYTGSSTPGIGASGAVMAVTMLYALHFPRETISVLWFFPLEMRWLMIGYVIWDLHPVLLALAGDRLYTGVAHSAHLGGLAFGFLYWMYGWRLDPLVERIPWLGPRWAHGPRLAARPKLRPRAEPAMSQDSGSALDRSPCAMTEDSACERRYPVPTAF